MHPGPRILIVGASGSGKTTMARALGKALAIEILELDPVHWAGTVGIQRDEDEAKALVGTFAARPAWVIEGVFGWLAAPALSRTTQLIWLDLPCDVCHEGLMQRGPWRNATTGAHAAFLEWAEAYWTRLTSSSFAGHLAMFDAFGGDKLRLRSREAMAEHLSGGTCAGHRALE